MRRLVEDERLGVGSNTREQFAPLFLLARQEADKGEAIERQPRADERGERSVCTRQRRDGDALRDGTPRKIPAGVGDARQPRVTDTDNGLPRLHPCDQFRAFFLFVMFVVARHRGMDVIVREEPARVPRVLGGDEICHAQHLYRAIGDVAEIADGGRAEIELSGHCHSSRLFFSHCGAQPPHCQGSLMKTSPLLKVRLYFSFLAFHFHAIHI